MVFLIQLRVFGTTVDVRLLQQRPRRDSRSLVFRTTKELSVIGFGTDAPLRALLTVKQKLKAKEKGGSVLFDPIHTDSLGKWTAEVRIAKDGGPSLVETASER